jgi:hypothetical protein
MEFLFLNERNRVKALAKKNSWTPLAPSLIILIIVLGKSEPPYWPECTIMTAKIARPLIASM